MKKRKAGKVKQDWAGLRIMRDNVQYAESEYLRERGWVCGDAFVGSGLWLWRKRIGSELAACDRETAIAIQRELDAVPELPTKRKARR